MDQVSLPAATEADPQPLASSRGAGRRDASRLGGRRPASAWRPRLFRSLLMGGFESSSHRRAGDRRQLDLIAATGHDEHAAADYRMLAAYGMGTARDALRWHLIEADGPGRYDWSSLLPMLRAARDAGVQVIWDLCHYGVPHDLDIWSPLFPERFAAFAMAAARVIRDESDGEVPFYCPVNEISFWAWSGGDHAGMYPYAKGRGSELKRQLARAAILAIDAVRSVDPRARFVHAEPLIHVTTPPKAPARDVKGAARHREAQFEACDMIAGRLAPELGGSEAHLDIVGVNFYPDNQMFRAGDTIPLGHWLYRPLRLLLADVQARYGRPILVSETGAEGPNGAGWLRYVAGEVRAALRAGIPVEGVCVYPVMDYPGWANDRHCRCGLIRAGRDWRTRAVDEELAEQLAEERTLLSPFTGASIA
jgi:beta-glucosidase/6-phospho-beta-glucosidase/beta-galactosidase